MCGLKHLICARTRKENSYFARSEANFHVIACTDTQANTSIHTYTDCLIYVVLCFDCYIDARVFADIVLAYLIIYKCYKSHTH